MDKRKVMPIIKFITELSFEDKVRLMYKMFDSKYIDLHIDEAKGKQLFEQIVRHIDGKNCIVNCNKYYNINYIISKLMEMSGVEQNVIAYVIWDEIVN